VKCLFFVYIKVVILIFINAAAMVELGLVSAQAHVKGSGREDIHVDGSASARDPPVEFETARPTKSLCAMLRWCRAALGPSTMMMSMTC
jgi:hypothetical protein